MTMTAAATETIGAAGHCEPGESVGQHSHAGRGEKHSAILRGDLGRQATGNQLGFGLRSGMCRD